MPRHPAGLALRSSSRLTIACLIGGLFCGGCGLFDSGHYWSDGPFALLWIDEPDDVSLSYDVGDGGWSELVAPRVFAIGADARYVVAQQHPDGDKSVTRYFIVDKQHEELKRGSTSAARAPLTEPEFQAKATELNLPPFTKVLEWLK